MTLFYYSKDVVNNLKCFYQILDVVPCDITALCYKRYLTEAVSLLALYMPTVNIRQTVQVRVVDSITRSPLSSLCDMMTYPSSYDIIRPLISPL